MVWYNNTSSHVILTRIFLLYANVKMLIFVDVLSSMFIFCHFSYNALLSSHYDQTNTNVNTTQHNTLYNLVPHPDPLVQSASMAAVDPPQITYQLHLPRKVIDRGLLSSPQLETVSYASQVFEQLLHSASNSPYRRGFFLGDGAGVGKGRQLAGKCIAERRGEMQTPHGTCPDMSSTCSSSHLLSHVSACIHYTHRVSSSAGSVPNTSQRNHSLQLLLLYLLCLQVSYSRTGREGYAVISG